MSGAAVSVLRVAVTGPRGRMGRLVRTLVDEADDLVVAATWDRDDPPPEPDAVDVVVDFTAPAAMARFAQWCARAGVPLVTGTTGLDEAARAALTAAARCVPVVAAPNMSTGVHVLLALVGAAVRQWPDADVEIVELHHRNKRDAPSGTARRIAEVVAEARRIGHEAIVTTRSGTTGPRPPGAIGVQALRGGDVVGEHTVLVLGDGERIELSHRATDRAIFARGALRAARWVAAGRSPGLYGMADVLGAARPPFNP